MISPILYPKMACSLSYVLTSCFRNWTLDVWTEAWWSCFHSCWMSSPSEKFEGVAKLYQCDNQAQSFLFSFWVWHQISWLWLMKPSSSMQSCIKVALDFVSPENVGECVKLTGEFRRLPSFHKAKEDKLEVSNVHFQWSGLHLWLVLSNVMNMCFLSD